MVPSVYARRQTRGLSRINGCEDTVHGLHAGPRGRLSSYHDELARGRDVNPGPLLGNGGELETSLSRISRNELDDTPV